MTNLPPFVQALHKRMRMKQRVNEKSPFYGGQRIVVGPAQQINDKDGDQRIQLPKDEKAVQNTEEEAHIPDDFIKSQTDANDMDSDIIKAQLEVEKRQKAEVEQLLEVERRQSSEYLCKISVLESKLKELEKKLGEQEEISEKRSEKIAELSEELEKLKEEKSDSSYGALIQPKSSSQSSLSPSKQLPIIEHPSFLEKNARIEGSPKSSPRSNIKPQM